MQTACKLAVPFCSFWERWGLSSCSVCHYVSIWTYRDHEQLSVMLCLWWVTGTCHKVNLTLLLWQTAVIVTMCLSVLLCLVSLCVLSCSYDDGLCIFHSFNLVTCVCALRLFLPFLSLSCIACLPVSWTLSEIEVNQWDAELLMQFKSLLKCIQTFRFYSENVNESK